MDEIDRFHEIEVNNYRASKKYLGDTITLIQDLHSLYCKLNNLLDAAIKNSGVEPTDEQSAISTFLTASDHYLTIATLAMLRGHLTDTYSHLRKSIELCAFAARVKKHPHLVTEYLSASKDDASYKQYLEKFSGGKLFSGNGPLLEELGQQYDRCSKLSHSSVYFLAKRLTKAKDETGPYASFHHFELSDEDPGALIKILFIVVETHLKIIEVFAGILSSEIAHDQKSFEQQKEAVRNKITSCKAKLLK